MGVKYDDEKPDTRSFAERATEAIVNARPREAPTRVRYDDEPPGGTQTGAIVKGLLPVIGPLLEKGVTALAAAPAAVLPGEGFGAMYNKMQRGQEQYERDNPGKAAAGGLGGAALGVPAMRAAPRAFGGGSFAGQSAAGAGWGGADAAVRSGGDPHEIAKGAVIGGAGPTFGSLFAPVGQAIASAGGAIGRGLGIAAPKTRLTPQGALDAADAGYKSLGQHVRYDPGKVADWMNIIRTDLKTQSIATPNSASLTHAKLADINNLPPNPASLHRTRKDLQEIINGANAGSAEAQAALHAKNMIDQFLERPPPGAVLAAPGHAATVFPRLEEANNNWRIGRTAETVAQRRTNAETAAAGSRNPIALMPEGPEIVKQFKNLATSNRATRFMSPEDLADVNRVVAPQSAGERVMRYAGALSGTAKPSVFTGLPIGGSFLASGGDPVLAATLFAGGTAGQLGSSALTRQAANAAEQSILSRSPYGQAAARANAQPNVLGSHVNPTAPQPSIGAIPFRNEIARLLALQGERSAVEP